MAKQLNYILQRGSFVSIYGISVYFYFFILSDLFNGVEKKKDTVEISKRIQKYTSIEETKESFVKGSLVSSVVGGWAHCAPSPTTRVAGHAGVAGHAVAAA
jgi:hypothetical protein